MRTFEYRAAGVDGVVVEGHQLAASELELDRELEGRALTLIRARAVKARKTNTAEGRLSRDDLLALTTQLATVSSAGVRIIDGLEGIGQRLAKPGARALVERMCADLRAGSSLSEAMARFPRAFPLVYRESVRGGEESGALDRVLVRLARYLEWSRGMRATTLQALIYPTILFTALTGLVLVLLYYVLPRIIVLFPGGREQLPTETQIVLGVSDFLTGNWVALVTGGVLAGAGFWYACKQQRSREVLDGFLLRVPRLGTIMGRLATSRFASTASTLQGAGCDVFTVLSISGATCGNAAMSAAFTRTSEGVRRGATITEGIEAEPTVDPLLAQMVAVGESTGSLDLCLSRLVEYYDDEVPRAVKRFLSFLEPAMLLVAGGVVAFILLAAILPIFALYETIG